MSPKAALEVEHRGGAITSENYRGIPVHAAPGVHAAAVARLKYKLPDGARVLDLGAGQGALSQRLHEEGFDAVPIDLSAQGWLSPSLELNICDLDGDWSDIEALGPFDAAISIDVIEHLENPRDFLRKIIVLAGNRPLTLVISTPNPLDTFSAIALFRRGTFNWFSRAHYAGGGHISILPYWLIDQHIAYLGQGPFEWSFHAPFRHRSRLGRAAYSAIALARRVLVKGDRERYHDGEAALGIVEIMPCAAD